MVTKSEFEAFDRRSTAVHEAGHAVMMTIFEQPLALVQIWENDPDTDEWVETLVLGQIVPDGPIDDEVRQIVGMAGSLAETIDTEGVVHADEWLDWREGGYIAVSATDAELIGEEVDPEEVEEAITLLQDYWPAVEAVAKALMEHEMLSGKEVAELVDQHRVDEA